MATFINAKESSEIIFTRNATEAINLVAYSWGLSNIRAGDEVFFCTNYKLAVLHADFTALKLQHFLLLSF